MIYAQWAVLVLMTINILLLIKYDIEGRPVKEPKGFEGVIVTLIAFAFTMFLQITAGTFSLIF